MSYAEEQRRREQLQREERQFNTMLIAQAQASGRSVSAVAPDGCEVTATPGGAVFYNAADWY